MAAISRDTVAVSLELENWLKDLGLCDSFKLASTLMLEPESHNVTDEIKKWIKHLSVEKAFKLNGILMLYSGPRDTLFKAMLLHNKRAKKNHGRAFAIINDQKHSIIDRTIIGKRLNHYQELEHGVFTYTYNSFITEKNDGDVWRQQQAFAQEQADIIMGFASTALIFAKSGDVETIVCGADLRKVFMLFELPALMANKKIERINGVDSQVFRVLYFSGDKNAPYKTFQKICESEVALLKEKAEACGLRKNARPWRQFKIQSDLWQEEKKETLKLSIA